MREGPDASSSQREGPSTGDPAASACASGPSGRQPNTSASSHVVLRQWAPEWRRHRPLLTPICRWNVRLFSRKPSRSHHLLCTLFLLNASCALEMMCFFFWFHTTRSALTHQGRTSLPPQTPRVYFGSDKFQRNLETGEEPDGLTFWRSTRTKEGRWSSDAAKKIYESAFSKIAERIEFEASVISKEQERHILHETYKETTGCRSRKGPRHGYLAKYPIRSQLMNERIEEQARASALAAAAQQKNSEMQAEVKKLKEKVTVQAAERESDKEKIQQLQHQLESTSSKIREELRQEFFSLIKQHNQAPPLNVAPTTTAPQPTENMVSGNEGADLAQAGTKSALPTHNELAVVLTPIQGSEHMQQTVYC